MAPRKTTASSTAKTTRAKAAPKVEEEVVLNEEVDETPVEETHEEDLVEEPVVEDDPTVEEIVGSSGTTDTLTEYPGHVHLDVSRLFAIRGHLDTSGTAGEADHDILRTAATWDHKINTMEEVPEHLQKHLDGSQSLEKIKEQAYRS